MFKFNLSDSEGALKLMSPKNKRLTIVRRYQAFGNARISVNLLMSYLNEADPISIIAEIINEYIYSIHRYN